MATTARTAFRAATAAVKTRLGYARARVRRRHRTLDRSLRPGAERGRVLCSYLAQPLTLAPDDARFGGHTNAWEARAICMAFLEAGFRVDAIDWDDVGFRPMAPYDVIFDLHTNLARLGSTTPVRWLHITGSHPRFSTDAELDRLKRVALRRGVRLRPRRAFSDAAIEEFDRSLAAATTITLIGDGRTLETLPRAVRDRVRLSPVTASRLPTRRDVARPLAARDFLWFNGTGAVHKGLDVVLEAFARNPRLRLHCVGPYERETDFVREYRRELYATPNIVSHGYLSPADQRFEHIANRAIAFLQPSCSEGISTAALTCLQYGTVPIVSDRCGLPVHDGFGVELHECSVNEVEEAAHHVAALSDATIRQIMGELQRWASTAFSQQRFQARFTELVAETTKAL